MGAVTFSWSENEPLCGERSPEKLGEVVSCLLPRDMPGPALHLVNGCHMGKRSEGEIVLWPYEL